MMNLATPSWANGYARCAAESQYPELWNGLTAAYIPSFGPTGTELKDLSGRENHGTMVPAISWLIREKGYELDFDGGGSSYITIDKPSIGGLSTATVSIDFSIKLNGNNNRGLLGIGSNDTRICWIYIGVSDNTSLTCQFAGIGFDSPSCTYGKTHNITITFDNKIITFYFDGKYVEWKISASKTLNIDNSVFKIGSLVGYNTHYGTIGKTLLYSRTLSVSEIVQLVSNSISPFQLKNTTMFSIEGNK